LYLQDGRARPRTHRRATAMLMAPSRTVLMERRRETLAQMEMSSHCEQWS
jgi:hypothetical protein